MAEIEQDLEVLDQRLAQLEGTVQGAQTMTSVFRTEIEDVAGTMRHAARDATGLSRSLGSGLKSAFNDLIFDGARLSDVLGQVGRGFANSVLNSAITPITDALGGLVTTGLSGLTGGAFAKGGVFSQGKVAAFANGGVVDGPTTFPMRRGVGLMGEAGPEAIMPLARGTDGKLGVRGGGRSVNVTMNITTPDVTGFSRSRGQIAAQMSRALGRGNRNL